MFKKVLKNKNHLILEVSILKSNFYSKKSFFDPLWGRENRWNIFSINITSRWDEGELSRNQFRGLLFQLKTI